MTENLVKTLMPPSYKYLLWSASTGSCLFDMPADKRKPKKNQKYLIYEAQQKSQQ